MQQTMQINKLYALTKMDIVEFDNLVNTNYAQQNFAYVLQVEKYNNANTNVVACTNCILVKNNNVMYVLNDDDTLTKCTFAQAMQILATTFTQL